MDQKNPTHLSSDKKRTQKILADMPSYPGAEPAEKSKLGLLSYLLFGLFVVVFLGGRLRPYLITQPTQPQVTNAPAVGLSGDWSGAYHDRAGNNQPFQVPFLARLMQEGEQLTGMIIEPNTFSNQEGTRQLNAVIEQGQVRANAIVFTKRYTGEGGYTHAIHYEGVWNESSKVILGNWNTADKGRSGTFEMRRTTLANGGQK